MEDQTDRVARELPYLRRYARAITGSQSHGDRYVTGCIETLLEQPLSPGDGTPRLMLFQRFHDVLRTVNAVLPDGVAATDTGTPGDFASKLETLPAPERQVLVLVALEGFTLDDVATILRMDRAAAETLLADAKEQLKTLAPTSVLIIEDESIIALDIAQLVTQAGHRVVGIAATEDEAIQISKGSSPGLILADIQLADGSSGIDAVNRILRQHDAPVIFVTAFPERLLTGERPEPTFLITKPFEPETLQVTISQALERRTDPTTGLAPPIPS